MSTKTASAPSCSHVALIQTLKTTASPAVRLAPPRVGAVSAIWYPPGWRYPSRADATVAASWCADMSLRVDALKIVAGTRSSVPRATSTPIPPTDKH